MKKLTKLGLHDVQIMDDAQMKHILGGGDGGDGWPEGYHPDPAVRACNGIIGGTPGDIYGKDCGYMMNGTFHRGTCQFHDDPSFPMICSAWD